MCIPRRRKKRRIEVTEGWNSSRETSKSSKRKYNELAAVADLNPNEKKLHKEGDTNETEALANYRPRGKEGNVRENLPSSDQSKVTSKSELSIANQEKPRAKNLISYFEKINSREAQPTSQPKSTHIKVTPPCPSEARAKILPPNKPVIKNSAKKAFNKRISPGIQKITKFFLTTEVAAETQLKKKASQ